MPSLLIRYEIFFDGVRSDCFRVRNVENLKYFGKTLFDILCRVPLISIETCIDKFDGIYSTGFFLMFLDDDSFFDSRYAVFQLFYTFFAQYIIGLND